MKQIFNILVLAVCAATMLCSCSKAKNIEVSEDNITFAINGGEKTIDVTADGSYDIQDCPEWVKAEADESTLKLTVGENTTGAVRDCVIKLVGSDIEVPIRIIQADKCTFIKVSETEVTLPKEGGSKELTVETDGGNIAMNASDGFEATLADGILKITAPANEGGTINGTLTLTCDEVKTDVSVTVEGNICPTCNGTGKVRCSKCGGQGYTFEFVPGPYNYYEFGCSNCGGSGEGFGDAPADGSTHYTVRKGSGKMNCPTCGGTGH